MTPIEIIKKVYDSRKAKNAAYSLNAFSRDAGMSQPQLSRILNGSRSFTVKQAQKFSLLLNLDQATEKQLLESTILGSKKVDVKLVEKIAKEKQKRESKKAVELDIEKYLTISKWYHLPLFTLVTTVDFKNNPTWIAERLGITTQEAREAIERLIAVGFLKREGTKLVPTNEHVTLMTKDSKAAVREHHAQMMTHAKETMMNGTDEKSFKLREISGVSIAVDMKNLEAAKAMVIKFEADMAALLTEGNATEVYQLNVQLFPLSKRGKSS